MQDPRLVGEEGIYGSAVQVSSTAAARMREGPSTPLFHHLETIIVFLAEPHDVT